MKPILPRTYSYLGEVRTPTLGEQDTWLESEGFCGPKGRMLRRCRAINKDTGDHQIVWCGIPDTYFTIIARGGYISISDMVFYFHPSE